VGRASTKRRGERAAAPFSLPSPGEPAAGHAVPRQTRPVAGLDHELAAWSDGHRIIAGVDEAGRGAWAGPVVAAAVVLCHDLAGLAPPLREACDSKALPPDERERIGALIRRHARAIGVGSMPVEVIDALGVGRANRLAMRAAVEALPVVPDLLLIDWERIPGLAIPQRPLVGGDAICLSIAAASIVAKVTRDRLLVELDARFPGYGFARHKGYGTAGHQAALARLGPCPVHRRSFAPVAQLRLALGPEDQPS